jgi:flagellar motor switch protein FliN/FliY
MAEETSTLDPSTVAADSIAAPNASSVAESTAEPDPFEGGELDQAAIDELLKAATFDDATASGAAPSEALDSVNGIDATDATADADDFKLPDFQQVMQDAQVSSIDLLRDVDLDVKIELGRSRMLVEDVLKLAEGSVVELDKLAGDPVDVFVNERLVARGEVLVLNDNFCVRINEIVAGVRVEGV